MLDYLQFNKRGGATMLVERLWFAEDYSLSTLFDYAIDGRDQVIRSDDVYSRSIYIILVNKIIY